MVSKLIVKTSPYGLSFVIVLAWAVVALAGGFWITVDAPSKTDAQMKDAVLIVRPDGCQRPSDANLTGTAEGLVNGQRRSIPLQFTATSKGVYLVKQQWPAQGVWVVAITGSYLGHSSSALVQWGPNGAQNLPARTVARKLQPEEINTALTTLASQSASASR